jgi:hypothetical protein
LRRDKRNTWSSIEKEKLYNGLKQYGRHWGQIADLVQTRTRQACESFILQLKPQKFKNLDPDVRQAILNKKLNTK